MQLLARIRWLTLFAIQHLPHPSSTPSHTKLLSHHQSHTTIYLIQLSALYHTTKNHIVKFYIRYYCINIIIS